jgi:hypothetical protein
VKLRTNRQGRAEARGPRGDFLCRRRHYYAELFPHVEDAVHRAVDELDVQAIKQLPEESQPAALSPIGADVKRSCEIAYRDVGDRVEGVGE